MERQKDADYKAGFFQDSTQEGKGPRRAGFQGLLTRRALRFQVQTWPT